MYADPAIVSQTFSIFVPLTLTYRLSLWDKAVNNVDLDVAIKDSSGVTLYSWRFQPPGQSWSQWSTDVSLGEGDYILEFSSNAFQVIWLDDITILDPVGYGVWHTLGDFSPSCKCADPVNTSTGNFTYEHQDLYVPSRGFPFDLSRTYNSLDNKQSTFGIGWAGSYVMTATEAGDGSVYVANEDGRWDLYRPGGGAYIADAGANAELAKVGGTFIFTRPNQMQYRVDASTGRLQSIADKNGNAIQFGGVVAGQQTVTDTVGRLYTFTYDG